MGLSVAPPHYGARVKLNIHRETFENNFKMFSIKSIVVVYNEISTTVASLSPEIK